MGGIKVWLTDTAGLREEKEEIEAEGIRRAEKEIETANLIIYLFDLGIGIENNVKETLKNSDFLLIGNKLDIFSGEDWKCDLKISALRGDGLFELREMIAQKAYDGNIEGEIIANERHMEALKNASMALANAIKIAEIKGETELLALEIREASQALGNIVGEGVTEEVLERIFSRFCIGK
jgi:tRNA modification GTPase